MTGNTGGGADIGAAFQFGIAVILFTLLGNWLDGKLGTAPVMLFVGMIVGAGAGFFALYRKLAGK